MHDAAIIADIALQGAIHKFFRQQNGSNARGDTINALYQTLFPVRTRFINSFSIAKLPAC
jgi:hypothetical protein